MFHSHAPRLLRGGDPRRVVDETDRQFPAIALLVQRSRRDSLVPQLNKHDHEAYERKNSGPCNYEDARQRPAAAFGIKEAVAQPGFHDHSGPIVLDVSRGRGKPQPQPRSH